MTQATVKKIMTDAQLQVILQALGILHKTERLCAADMVMDALSDSEKVRLVRLAD